MSSLVTILAPAVVAVLTAAGAVIGLQFRDVDAYERRRGIWQWLLVLLAAAATMGAVGSASGVGAGDLREAIIMAVVGVAAVIVAHVMWRRRVPDAEPRNVAIATAAAACAVLVIAGVTALTYTGNKGCRQAQLLVDYTNASLGALTPPPADKPGPAVGDYENWSKLIREAADQVTDGEVGPHARRMSELAGQITDAVRNKESANHALLGVQYSEEFKAIVAKCQRK